jgi:hypothetical protein
MSTININDSLLDPSGRSRMISLPKLHTGVYLPPIRPWNELVGNDAILQPTELVKGLLHSSTKGVLGGSSKAGKTWILLDMAVAVASGGTFLNYSTTRGKVLFMNFEIQEAFFKERLRAVMERRGIQTADIQESLDVWTLRGQKVDAEDFLTALANRVRNSGYSLIVIDPIYKLMVGRSESSTRGVGMLCYDIERLMTMSDAAVVYAHHFTKGNQAKKKAMDRMSGSGVFARDADTIITLTDHAMEGCFAVEVTQRNMASPKPFVVEWDWPLMVVRPDLDPADLNDNTKENQQDVSTFLLSLLRSSPLTSTAWQSAAEEGGVSRATFFRRKAQLEENGEVQCDPSTNMWFRPAPEVSPRASET